MSIASELNALNGHILDSYDEISTMGGTVPANKNMASLATAIASIPSGGGGGDSTVETGTVTMPTSGAVTINHSLGAIPSYFTVHLQWTYPGSGLYFEAIGYCSKSDASYYSGYAYNLYVSSSGKLNTITGNSVDNSTVYITMDATTITLTADFMQKACSQQLTAGTAFWMATTKGIL